MAVVVKTFPDGRSFVDAVVQLVAAEWTRDSRLPHATMLSGGKTPLAAYSALAESPPTVSCTAWSLFSDERMVPADSPSSNYGNAASMVAAMGMRDEQILRVHTELPLEAAAARYDHDIEQFFMGGGHIALGLLGLGADGHTASLFTLEDVERGADQWAIAVPKTDGPDRVSVTAALIRRIDRIVFLAAGAEKDAAIELFLKEPGRIPAGTAVEGAGRVELWRI